MIRNICTHLQSYRAVRSFYIEARGNRFLRNEVTCIVALKMAIECSAETVHIDVATCSSCPEDGGIFMYLSTVLNTFFFFFKLIFHPSKPIDHTVGSYKYSE